MAWSWSHSGEAYANAQANLENLPREDLEIIFAEWRASQGRAGIVDPAFSPKKYDRALKWAKTMPADWLAEFIWERMAERRTCDNGGFDAHCCPHGCHTVSFDLENAE